MDTGTKVVLLAAAIISLITAVIAYRTAKLKHDNSVGGSAINKKEPGPFDDMLEMLGMYGLVFAPMLFFVVYVGAMQLISAIPSSFQSADRSVSAKPAMLIDRTLLTAKEVRLFDLAETAAAMSGGRSRTEALRHVVDLSVAENAYQIALLAAARIQQGNDRDAALTLVALKAVGDIDAVTASKAVGEMHAGTTRDETARRVMAILEDKKSPPIPAPPTPSAAGPKK